MVIEVRDQTGEAHAFYLDTAAAATVVSPATSRALGAVELSSVRARNVHGAFGWLASTTSTVRIPRIHIEELVVRDLIAIESDLSVFVGTNGCGGILGQDVLARSVLQIDYPRSRVTFFDPARRRSWCDVRFSPGLTIHRHPPWFVLLPAVLGSGPTAMLILDTASAKTILNRHAAILAHAEIQAPDAGATRGSAVGGDFVPLFECHGLTLALETVTWRDVTLYTADLPVFAAMGMDRVPVGILGNDLLATSRLTIDYASSRLELKEDPIP